MNIFCSQQTISQVDSVKYLGILIDSKLTWTPHLENLGKKDASGASVLFKLQPCADVHLLRIVYFSLVYSHLIYGILNCATANWSSIAEYCVLGVHTFAQCTARTQHTKCSACSQCTACKQSTACIACTPCTPFTHCTACSACTQSTDCTECTACTKYTTCSAYIQCSACTQCNASTACT